MQWQTSCCLHPRTLLVSPGSASLQQHTHTRGLHNEVAASLAEFQVYLGLACLSLGSAERNWQCPAPVATKLTSVVAPVCCSLVLQTMPRASSQERPRRQKISVGKAFQLLVCVLLAALAGSGGW